MPNVLPCMRDWYEEHIAGPARIEAEIAKAESAARQAAKAAIWTATTDATELDRRALIAIQDVVFGFAHTSKRFARQMAAATELTGKQRAFLWSIVFHFRRQIEDAELVRIATEMEMREG